MGRFRVIHRGSPTPTPSSTPTPTPTSGALIGMNMNIPAYETNSKPYASYLAYAEAWEYQDSSGNFGPIYDTYFLAHSVDGWPSSAPSVDPSGNYTFRKSINAAISAPQTLNVTWTGNAVSVSAGGNVSGWTSTGTHSATFVNNLGMATADPEFANYPTFGYSITPGDANFARNFFISAPGVTFAEPAWVTDMTNMVTGPIRMMDPANVNGNMGIWPSSPNGSVAFPSPTVTAANRNTPTGGNWGPTTIGDSYNNHVKGHDGWPIEIQFALARAVGRDLWTSLQPNGSDDYFDLLATWIRDYETVVQPNQTTTQPWPTGGQIYLQVSNETWNSGFPYYDQLNVEGSTLGFSSPALMRYGQRSSQIFKRFEAILGPAGKMNRIVRILDFQEVGSSALVDLIMPFNIGDGTTVLSHHDMITAAAYFDASGYSGTDLTVAFSTLYASIEQMLSVNIAYKNKATSYGLKYGSYEGGQGTSVDGGALGGSRSLLRSFIADTRMQAAVTYFLQQWEAQLGSDVPMCWYAYAMRESGGQDWGIKNWTGGPDTPSSLALKNFTAGTRVLNSVRGTLSAATDMSVGAVVGTLTGRTKGSTLSISGTNFAVNSTTGVVTIASTSGLVAATPVNVTITETHPNASNSGFTTTLSVEVLGPQMLVNGDFSAGSTGWTITDPNVTISGGVANCVADSVITICQQPVTYVNGAHYRCSFDASRIGTYVWGALAVNLANTLGGDIVVTTAAISSGGHYILDFVANVTSGFFRLDAAGAPWGGPIDNLSLRRLS